MAQCPECGGQTQVPAQEISPGLAPLSQSGAGDSFASGGYQATCQTIAPQWQGPGAPGNAIYASNRVSAPAICLIVVAILGLVLNLLGMAYTLFIPAEVFRIHGDRIPQMMISGPVALIQGILEIVLCTIVLIGAIKMKGLENYGFAIAASIIALIPCIGPCCGLGLPFGIWALVVLSDPVVKSSFKS
jgi:hypothetical protein